MTKKIKDRVIYGFMAVLLLVQYVAPITAVAQTLTETAPVELTEAVVTEKENERVLTLTGTVRQEEDSSKTITVEDGVSFIPQAQQTISGLQESTYIVEQDKIVLTIAAQTDGVFSIKVPLNVQSLTNKSSIRIQLDNQTLEAAVPAAVEDSTIETTDSEAAVSSATTTASTTTTDTTETTTESTETIVERPAAKAVEADATDIRTYFENGDGTIFTGTDISYYDENGVKLEPPVPADATVRVHYDWEIPEDVREQIKGGDYFTFELPEGVQVTGAQTGELANEDGEVYANYTVDENGVVTIVFNDRVTQESEINGQFDFDMEFDTTHIDGPGDITITYPEEDNLPPVNVTVRPATDTSIAKKGSFDRTPNPSEVTWQVDFNQGMEPLTNPTITEHWPSGLTYESVVVYKLVMNLDGTVAAVGEPLDPSEYTVDANGNVTITGDTTDAYRIEYHTSIDDAAIPENGGKVSFTNTATLTDDNDSHGIDAKASVTSSYGKMLEKNRTGYDAENQEFSWEIKYNYGEKHIDQSDAVITDSLSDNMDFIADSLVLHAVSFDANGKEVVGRQLSAPQDYTVEPDPSGKGFVIKFSDDVEEAVKITYKTRVDGLVTDPTQVTNQVDVGTGEHAEGNGTAQQQNVVKSYSNVNYADGMMDWTIKVNQNNYHMENLVLTDTYTPTPGLSLAKTPTGEYQMRITDSSGHVLVAGTDYAITPTFDSAANETGFTIEFLGSYNPTEDSFTVRYTTFFDITLLDPNDPNMDRFVNGIQADWQDENGGDHQSGHETDFKPNPSYSLNAQKAGVYNAQTKKITWSIAVNLSRNILQNAFLIDQMKDNQNYVAGSLKVYEAITQANGTVIRANDTPVNSGMKSIEEPAAANNQTLEIHFPDQSQHTYLIEFETSVEGNVIESSENYENVAGYTNADDDRDVIGEVSVKNGGVHVQKEGEQDPAKPDFVNWHVTINPAQSTLNNVKVTDHPSTNQIVDGESVAVYQTSVAEDGTITPDKTRPLIEGTDYTLTLTTDNVTGEQILTVTFLHEISTAYYMEYRALINSSATGNSDVVSNQVEITGDGSQVIKDDGGEDVTVGVNHSGGSAAGTKGKIGIKKTAEDGATSLTGAHFQLWDTTRTQILREGDVDANGEITFGNLILGDYLLVETQAPDGYTIPNDLIQGRRVTITAATSAENASPLIVTNTPNKVFLTKTGENNELLAGAEFRLEKQTLLGTWRAYPQNPYVTNAQGRLEIDSLELGNYRLIETIAPAGYLINSTPILFTVSKNGNNQIPTVNLAMTDYQGSAELVKTNEAGTGLQGAVFKIVNAAGDAVKSNLTTDADGKVTVTGLAPGEYTFVETQAPDGYVLNERSYPFTITESSSGKPAIVSAGTAINYQGSAELVKTDAVGNPLEGAVFKVVNSAGEPIKENLVSDDDGKVSIDGLAPGSYKFIETQAPSGYILNTEEADFDIVASSLDKPKMIQVDAFKNYKGSVKIRKVDTGSSPLAGGEFTLFDSNKHSLGIVETSGSDGWVQFNELAPGTYYLQETKAPELPDGSSYVINSYMVKVVIPDAAEGEPQVINLGDFQNFKGKAEITKEGNNAAIANAHFDLYLYTTETQQETFVKEIISDSNGHISLENLGAGSYKLVETKPAPGYILNTQPIYFVVDPELEDGPVDSFVYENYQSTVEALKVDGDGLSTTENQVLAGAEFQVFKQNADGSKGEGPISFVDGTGQQKDTVQTTADGKIVINGLEEGRYLLVEIQAPSDYVLNTNEIPFEITAALGKPDPIELGTIENYRGQIDIEKTDPDGTMLSGGTFVLSTTPEGENPVSVFNGSDEKVAELHAENGHIVAKGIAPGTYYLVETEAPDGFVLNTEPIKVVIAANAEGTNELTVSGTLINYHGSAELIKKDNSGHGLAGAEFKVIDSAGKTVQEGLTSNEDGIIIVEDLSPGDYQFVETKAPAGYILNETPVDFTIETEAEGKPRMDIAADNFVNYQGSAELIKKDLQGNVLANAEFKVINQDGEEVAVDLVSDETGKVSVNGLAPGTYQFIETKAPTGYILNETPVDFTIEAQEAGEPVVVVADDNFINYQGSAELIKKDSEGNPLSDAEFQVVDEDGTLIQDKLVSDETGKVSVAGLAPGNYQFIETKAPTGYILNETPVDFAIEAQQAGAPDIVVAADDFVNYQGSAELIKKDSEGNPLSGAEFQVVDEDGTLIQDKLVSDETGKVSVAGLAPGAYQFIETKAPTGYILNETPVDFAIEAQQAGAPDIVVAADDFVNYQGSAELIKKDSEGNPLSGAEFQVVDEAGVLIQDKLVSDGQGRVRAEGLAPGNYQFIETKAPAGYILNETPVDFTIVASTAGAPDMVTADDDFINYQGSVELTKTDSNHAPLSGASFNVLDSQGNVVQKNILSDKDGKVTVNNLQPGTYYFVEAAAPAGYSVNTQRVSFTIAASATGKPDVVQAGNFINYKKKETILPGTSGKMPSLGDLANSLGMVLGLVVIAASLIYWNKHRKMM